MQSTLRKHQQEKMAVPAGYQFRRMLAVTIGATLGALFMSNAGAVPITVTHQQSGFEFIWSNGVQVDRHGDFAGQDGSAETVQFSGFNSALGTLLSTEFTFSSTIAHPVRKVSLDDPNSFFPIVLNFSNGAMAQDTEREFLGSYSLSEYFDARVAYRSDNLFRVVPQFAGLFAPGAAEAAFGSCVREESNFLGFGDENPYCVAENRGLPLTTFAYDWGQFSGSDLAPFIDTGSLFFDLRLTGDMFGSCDDDNGDYCRVNLETQWVWALQQTFTYEPGVQGPPDGGGDDPQDPGDGGGSDPVAVPEPDVAPLLALGLGGIWVTRRRRTASFLAHR